MKNTRCKFNLVGPFTTKGGGALLWEGIPVGTGASRLVYGWQNLVALLARRER
jgi:hypothetical protein